MAIAHIGTDSSGDITTAPSTLSVTKPTGFTPDGTNILWLAVGGGASGATPPNYTAPSGWTVVGSLLNQANGSSHIGGQVWWALDTVANLGFTKSANAGTAGWIMVATSGADTTTPVDATGTANSVGGSNTITGNAVSIATTGAWLAYGMFDWLGGNMTASGFTRAENAAANESAELLYNTTGKSIGNSGTTLITDSAGTTGQIIIAIPFAIRPASGGGGGSAAPMLPLLGAGRHSLLAPHHRILRPQRRIFCPTFAKAA